MPPTDLDTLDSRRRMIVLAVCCLSLFIVGIDVTAVNLALPSINTDLGASPTQLQWVLDGYTLVLAGLLMLSGSTADRVGRRRTFQTGLVLFGLGSLLCSLAPNPGLLIAARCLQAVGGSMLNPVAMSIITNTFTDARQRAQAIGLWGATIGISMALGPVIGGALVDAINWRAIFWLNVPITLVAALLAARFVPESRAPTPRRFDPVGQLLMVVLLAALTYAIIEGRGYGWGSPVVVGCFVAAGASVLALLVYEPRRQHPLLEFRFFASIPFSSSVICAIIGFAANGGFLLVNTLYLQQGRLLLPLAAGLMTLPMAITSAITAPIAGRLVGRIGPRVPMVLSGCGIIACSVMLSFLTTHYPGWLLGIAYACFGLGFGFLNAPITNSAVSGMPRAQAGVAAAIASTSRQVGTVLGVAVFGALLYGRIDGPVGPALARASHPGWLVMGCCGAGLIVMGLVATSARARASAQAVGADADPQTTAAPARATI